MKAPVIFIVAGEASGDFLGSRLMYALKEQFKDVVFHGIGGTQMEKVGGFTSFFPMHLLSVMGILEIIPRLFRLVRLFRQVFCAIKTIQPDIVITIDSPGFNYRLAKKVKSTRETHHIPIIHYVAPTVWAWRPKRAKKFARYFDHMLCLFPFEPRYFKEVHLLATFIGHAVTEVENNTGGDATAFKIKYKIREEEKVLCLLPGSRKSEVKKLMPIFKKTVEKLQKNIPHLRVVLPTTAAMHPIIHVAMKGASFKATIVEGKEEKEAAFKVAHAALAASGTVSMELACARVPMIIVYKVTALTYMILKYLVKVPYICLVNILLNRPAVPEFIQYNCRPDRLTEMVGLLLNDTCARRAQIKDLKEAVKKVKLPHPQPSYRAAAIIARYIMHKEPRSQKEKLGVGGL